jgi:hypothetical protein
MVEKFFGDLPFDTDRSPINGMFILAGYIHNPTIADMHVHATVHSALAAQGLDIAIMNRCFYFHRRSRLFYQIGTGNKKMNELADYPRRDSLSTGIDGLKRTDNPYRCSVIPGLTRGSTGHSTGSWS